MYNYVAIVGTVHVIIITKYTIADVTCNTRTREHNYSHHYAWLSHASGRHPRTNGGRSVQGDLPRGQKCGEDVASSLAPVWHSKR